MFIIQASFHKQMSIIQFKTKSAIMYSRPVFVEHGYLYDETSPSPMSSSPSQEPCWSPKRKMLLKTDNFVWQRDNAGKFSYLRTFFDDLNFFDIFNL